MILQVWFRLLQFGFNNVADAIIMIGLSLYDLAVIILFQGRIWPSASCSYLTKKCAKDSALMKLIGEELNARMKKMGVL